MSTRNGSAESTACPVSGGKVKEPKYVRIKTHLLRQMLSGAYAPGVALPKERELATSLGVAMGTLRHALKDLEAEGLIRRVRGQGTFANTAEQRRSRIQTTLLALIVPQVREGLYPSVIHGFEEAIAGTPYQMTVGNSYNNPTRQENLVRRAIESHAAGIAIIPTTFPPTPPEQLRMLQEQRVPTICCHRSIEGMATPLVTWSGAEVGRMTARVLLERGHRRIVTVVAFRDPKVCELTAGIRQELSELGFLPSAYSVRYHGERLPGIHARQAIGDVLKDLFGGPEPPTAIHCANLPDAEQVFLLAGELGLSIPRDLSLIYFGDTPRTGGLAERLTCVAVDAEEIGRRASTLLVEMVAGKVPLTADLRIDVPLTFFSGETICTQVR